MSTLDKQGIDFIIIEQLIDMHASLPFPLQIFDSNLSYFFYFFFFSFV